jgi:hypothetical protein
LRADRSFTLGAASVLFLSETVFDTYAIFLVAIIGLNHLFIIIHTYDRGTCHSLTRVLAAARKGRALSYESVHGGQ